MGANGTGGAVMDSPREPGGLKGLRVDDSAVVKSWGIR